MGKYFPGAKMGNEVDAAPPLPEAFPDMFFPLKLDMSVHGLLAHRGQLDAAEQVCTERYKCLS